MSLSLTDIATIRIHTQVIAIFQQKLVIEAIFEEMEEVWLNLHTREKTCPIIEQVGTNVKRKLVQRYVIELIRRMRRTVSMDLISKSIDPDAAYWVADDIVIRLADNKTESHRGLFNAVLVGVFGISTRILEFMALENPTKEDLYALIRRMYDVKVLDFELGDEVSIVELSVSLENYMTDKARKAHMFEADIF